MPTGNFAKILRKTSTNGNEPVTLQNLYSIGVFLAMFWKLTGKKVFLERSVSNSSEEEDLMNIISKSHFMKEGVLSENNVLDFSRSYSKDRVCHYSAKTWTQNEGNNYKEAASWR